MFPRAKFQAKHLVSQNSLNNSLKRQPKTPTGRNWIDEDSGPIMGDDDDNVQLK